jgi:hypothetical protein
MDLDLNALPNNVIHASGFSVEVGGIVSRVDEVFSYG